MHSRRALPIDFLALAALAILARAALAPAAENAAPAASWHWRLDQSGAAPGGASSVARSPAGQIASGGPRGISLSPPRAGARRVALRAPVTDLVFDAGGRLWIATTNGVFRLDPGSAVPRDVSPGGGERSRAATRIAAAGPEVAVATGAGVFWRRGGDPWRRIGGALGELPATALALAGPGAGPFRLWVATDRSLHVAEPSFDPVARKHPVADAGGRIVDLHADGSSLWVLTTRALLNVAAPGARYPVEVAAGDTARRLARVEGEFFLATGRGLWLAPGPAGPWRRAGEPAGYDAWSDLAVWPGRAVLAGARGLLYGTRGAPASPGPGKSREVCAPPIAEVHRSVLRYLQLGGDPVERMRRGVRRRGWLPQLRLQGSYASDRDRGEDFDQSYISGGLRELRDWDDDRARTRDLSVALTWELGDLLYHPEEIDISTEARRLIELRDDVLDEVNQLYFDRERALGAAPDPLAAARFGAGLDAWTGGWFSRASEECPAARRD